MPGRCRPSATWAKAEASRFVELRNFLQTQDNTHMARNAERDDTLLARIAQLEKRLDQSASLSAARAGRLAKITDVPFRA